MQRFILDGRYKDLLEFYDIDTAEVLKTAGLSPHALNARSPWMSEEEYYRFWKAIEEMYQDDTLPLKLATVNKIETFSPPIFAAFCTGNGNKCFAMLSRYKRLISPMRFDIIKELDASPSYSQSIKELIEKRLPGGFSIEEAARALKISPRTLQRKLKEENTSFSGVLSQVRNKLAVNYVKNKDININDIAFMLGYAEVNSFLRFFKTITGKSVNEYRREIR